MSTTYAELQAMYDAQCACTDEWVAKYEAEKEKKASATLLNRIAELKSQLAEVNQRLAAANEKVTSASENRTQEDDPGTAKLLAALVDRAYKIFISSVPSLRVTEQDADSNDPLVAWMSDVRSVLYRNKPVPDVFRDLLGKGNSK